jgi:RHS repeat-associated protein
MKKILNLYILFVLGITSSRAQQFTYTNSPDPTTVSPGTSPTGIPGIDYPSALSLYNAVRIWTPNKPYHVSATTSLTSSSMASSDADVAVHYYDGLGRPLQDVYNNSGLAPLVKDWVKIYSYNSKGEVSIDPNPYTAEDNNGKFKLDAENILLTRNASAYPGQLPWNIKIDDESPLSRPKRLHNAGKVDPNLHWKDMYYWTNASGEVYDIRIGDQPTSTPFLQGYYPTGTLEKVVLVDEDAKVSITYKDKSGKTILTKNEAGTTNSGSPHEGYACTYYVYNEKDELRCVITPKFIEQFIGGPLISGFPHTFSSGLSELYYWYYYDDKGRMTYKKIPGKDVEYFVYDNRDRVVFWQDGNLRNGLGYGSPLMSTTPKWKFFLYDVLDRKYAEGIYQPSSGSADLSTINYKTTGTYTPSSGEIFAFVRNYNAHQLVRGSITDCDIHSWDYYDHYSHGSHVVPLTTYFDNSWVSLLTGSLPQAPTPVVTNNTRGLKTASFQKILDGTTAYNDVRNEYFYDTWGRLIQEKKVDNATGMKNIITNQYNFSNEIASSVLYHNNPSAKTPANFLHPNIYKETTIVKSHIKNSMINKPWQQKQAINGATPTNIAQFSYDIFNRVSLKNMDATYEQYKYDINNQLVSINEDHVISGQVPGGLPRFGEILYYDKGFDQKYYNGNISGALWRGPGINAKQRFYGYMYDKLNRLTKADFGEYNKYARPPGYIIPFTTAFNPLNIDYSVPKIEYDINGNITKMDQRGTVTYGSPIDMDKLEYNYLPNSNKLDWVTDAGINATPLPDFKNNSTATSAEYEYDFNGNVVKDKNRDIATNPIQYDYNNKPAVIDVDGKGTVKYVYDASGNRLQKVVTDNLSSTTNVYKYFGPFVYKNDELQYIYHDEGRCRPKTDPNQEVAAYTYDYFTKDHLGNVRATVELIETGFPGYEGGPMVNHPGEMYVATHEVSVFNAENLVWDNIDDVWDTKPASTTPTDVMAAELDGANPSKRIGTAMMLRVMPGDVFETSSDTYYDGAFEPDQPSSGQELIDNLVTSLMQGTTLGGGSITENPDNINIIQNCLGNPSFMPVYEQLVNGVYDPTKPKALLNYLVFDDNYQLVENNSGVAQMNGSPNTWTQIGTPNTVTIGQPGYLVVFISSQAQNKLAYFDKVKLVNYTGTVLEEDHYYPYGLTLTTQPTNPLHKNYIKYNSKELQRDEFKDPTTGKLTGLEIYDYGARMYDPQIGRWMHIDPLANHENQVDKSPYSAFWGNPVKYTDPDGRCPDCPVDVYVPLSDHVYDAKVGDKTSNGWEVMRVDANDKTGYKGALYKGTFNNKTEYIYATTGTNDFKDVKNDLQQPISGNSAQYSESVGLAKDLAQNYKGVSFTGHSLGGGLASANALMVEGKAVTFNAAGLSNATKENLGLTGHTANISAFVVQGEAVSYYQGMVGLKAEGRITTLPASYAPNIPFTSIDNRVRLLQRLNNHRMAVVMEKFAEYRKK